MENNYDVMMKVRITKDDKFVEFRKWGITFEEAYKLIDKYQSRAFSRRVYEFKVHLFYRPEASTVFCVHVIPGVIR